MSGSGRLAERRAVIRGRRSVPSSPVAAARPSLAWRAHPRAFVVLLAFAAANLPLAARHLVPLTFEALLLCGLVLLTVLSKRSDFCWAWTPWLAAIVLLDDLRGFQAIGPPPHAADVAAAERWIFGGTLPVVALQEHWAIPGRLAPQDVVLGLLYLAHSPAPLLCGLALWRWRRRWFRPYVTSIVLAATVGLVTYLAFPETPPWLAAEQGIIPPVRRLVAELVAQAGPLAGVYSGADPLPNAAMPSLHVAYPCLVAWWAVRAAGGRVAGVLAYPAALAVGVVYLGEHWVLDVVAGVLVAAVAVVVAERLGRGRAAQPIGVRAPPSPGTGERTRSGARQDPSGTLR